MCDIHSLQYPWEFTVALAWSSYHTENTHCGDKPFHYKARTGISAIPQGAAES